jgi:glycosyltransferase involved in cell wall biosynthesis
VDVVRTSAGRSHPGVVQGDGSHSGPAATAGPVRPKMLFLCQTLPFPPDGGVSIRTYNILRLLAREFDITALCFFRAADRRNAAEVQKSVDGLRPLAEVEAFPIPQEHSKLRLLFDHGRSVLTRRAYTEFTYVSRAFRGRLQQLLEERDFEIVHLDSLDLAAHLPTLLPLPVICVHHNVESALLARRAADSSWPLSRYLRFQSRLTENDEARWCPCVALNVAVSSGDRDLLAQIAPEASFTVIPNGVNTADFVPGEQPEQGMVFVGSYGWQPNRDAMEYFCSEILPTLRARSIASDVSWIGRAPDAVRQEFASRHGVHLTGYVDDIRPLVQRAACYVAPLRSGGGTRLKILDAWAMGKAVVSTSVGCEGLEARDGENILIRDTPESFASAVESVLVDQRLRRALGKAARETAVATYDWEGIGVSMLAQYRAVLGRSVSTGAD